jgi:hypothetical protein
MTDAAKKSPRKPVGLMTTRRRQVLAAITTAIAAGERAPGVCEIARRCGLYDYRDARRMVRDLRKMGKIT